MAQAELSNQEVSFASETNGRGGSDVQVPSQSKPRNKNHSRGRRKTRDARSNADDVESFEMNNLHGSQRSYHEPFSSGVTFDNSRSIASRPNRYNNDDYHGYGNQSKQNYRVRRRNANKEKDVRPSTVSGSYLNEDRMSDNGTRVVESSNLLPDCSDLSESRRTVSSNVQKMPNAKKNRSERSDKQKNAEKSRNWNKDNGYQDASYRESKWSGVDGRSTNREPTANEYESVHDDRFERSKNGYGNIRHAVGNEEHERIKSDETLAYQWSSSEMYSDAGATHVSQDSFKSKSFNKSTGRSSTSANGYAQGYNASYRNGRRDISDLRRDKNTFYNGHQMNDRYGDRQYEHVEHRLGDFGHRHYRGNNENRTGESRVEHLGKHHNDRKDSQGGFHSQSWKQEGSSLPGNGDIECAVRGLSIKEPFEKHAVGEFGPGFRKDFVGDEASVDYGLRKPFKKFTSYKKNDQKLPVEDETQRGWML